MNQNVTLNLNIEISPEIQRIINDRPTAVEEMKLAAIKKLGEILMQEVEKQEAQIKQSAA